MTYKLVISSGRHELFKKHQMLGATKPHSGSVLESTLKRGGAGATTQMMIFQQFTKFRSS